VLGSHLEAFEKALPTLHALRLCHRFGRGDGVHVTRLPHEIEQTIENLVLAAHRIETSWSWTDWRSEFRCFECRCDPESHLTGEETTFYESVRDELQICQGCSDADGEIYGDACNKKCASNAKSKCRECSKKTGSRDCERACLAEYHELLNHAVFDNSLHFQEHEDRLGAWVRRISQAPGGAFEKYDQVGFSRSRVWLSSC
jgi:hypothetical protein